jgi:hypothetical protein
MGNNESNFGYWVALTHNSLIRSSGISSGLIIIVIAIISLIGRRLEMRKRNMN